MSVVIPIRMREKATLSLVVLLAILVRIWAAMHVYVVSEDSAGGYLYQAQELLCGNWKDGLGIYFPPGLPVAAALLSWWGLKLEVAGKLVGVLCGAGLVLPVFFFARRFYGNVEGWVAAILTATYPALIIYSADAVTEGPYTLLLCLLCWVGFTTLQDDSRSSWILMGFLFGLAYLFRGEVLGFLSLFILMGLVRFVAGRSDLTRRVSFSRYCTNVALLLAGFMILAFPYFVFLRAQTGRWGVSGKTLENLIAYDIDETGSPVDYEKARMGLSGDGEHLQIELRKSEGALRYIWSSPSRQMKRYLTNLTHAYVQDLPRVIPPLYLILMAVGIFSSLNARSEIIRELYFGIWFLLPFALYPVFLVRTRYFAPVVPLALLWTSRGVVSAVLQLRSAWTGSMVRSSPPPVWALASFVSILALAHQGPFVGHLRAEPWTFPLEHKAAGEWLLTHGRPHPKVLNRKSFVAFYSKGIPMVTPDASYEEIVRYARTHGVDYLVVDERFTPSVRPQLGFLLRGVESGAKDLHLVYSDTSHLGFRLFIYSFAPERNPG